MTTGGLVLILFLLGFFFDEAANRIRQTRPLRPMAASMGAASR